MEVWVVDVRYPGAPVRDWPNEGPDGRAEITSVTVDGDACTTFRLITHADSESAALAACILATDHLAASVGLDRAHVAAAVAI